MDTKDRYRTGSVTVVINDVSLEVEYEWSRERENIEAYGVYGQLEDLYNVLADKVLEKINKAIAEDVHANP